MTSPGLAAVRAFCSGSPHAKVPDTATAGSAEPNSGSVAATTTIATKADVDRRMPDLPPWAKRGCQVLDGPSTAGRRIPPARRARREPATHDHRVLIRERRGTPRP